MNYITLEKTETYPKICWRNIFPDKIRKSFFTIDEKTGIKRVFSQLDILKLLPPEITTGTNLDLLDRESDKGVISKIWNTYSVSRKTYETIQTNIIRQAKNGNYSYENFPPFLALKNTLKDLLAALAPDTAAGYEADISEIIKEFLNGIESISYISIYNNFKKENLRNLDLRHVFEKDLKDFYDRLTCLTLIASTWFYWERNESDVTNNLSLIIFPCHPVTVSDKSSAKDWRETQIQTESMMAKKLLAEAEKDFESDNYISCEKKCRKINAMSFAEDSVLGKACYLIVKCHNIPGMHYDGNYNSENFIRRAISLGCSDACCEWKALHMETLLYKPVPSISSSACVVYNCSPDAEQIQYFLKTLPLDMQRDYHEKSVLHASSPAELCRTISPEKRIRYLLINDDFSKNFQNLLIILDNIKSWKSSHNGSASPFITPDWTNISVYLRVREEDYCALLDTALKHMDGISIHVHIIDDAKWAAQNLLSHCPLFYPIRSLSENILNNQSVVLNYTIISSNHNDLTEWLIREAFWLGAFRYPGITLAINVISPDAELTEARLRYTCPGIFGTLPDSDCTSSVKFTFKTIPGKSETNSLFSPTLFTYLDETADAKNSFHYFVINADNDISGLNLAVRIREWSIRRMLHTERFPRHSTFPVIAFYCRNSDIAHLSESMIVQMEEHGDSWYNNYSLVPFGMLHEHYSWDELDGGYFEAIARSVHLQYCNISPDESLQKKNIALEDYYNRCHNRDSSMAAALSIPYRLFQTRTEVSDHILPDNLNPYTMNVYTDKSSIKNMAEQFQTSYKPNKQALLLYEHTRWVRLMLSEAGFVHHRKKQSVT